MADYIPFEIQGEIIKRIPDAKSLIRFRSVSKPWKFLIDSSEFIADFQVTHTQPHDHIIVMDIDPQDSKKNYFSIVDDDSFPKRKFSLAVPESVKQSDELPFVGSSQGLLCFYGRKPTDYRTKAVVLWNPTIRKSVDIVVPNVLNYPHDIVVAFGACPHTRDPMLVKINYISKCTGIYDISYIPWQVEVFTLSSRVWRSPSCSSNLPRKSICWRQFHIVIDEFIYWLVFDWNRDILIMSFDMANEEFADIYLPDCLTYYRIGVRKEISKLRGALAVLEIHYMGPTSECGVWMMEHGVPNTFTKCFTIKAPVGASMYDVLGFRKSGEAIIETESKFGKNDLSLYEPCSKQVNDIGISGSRFLCFPISYMETLLLLDL